MSIEISVKRLFDAFGKRASEGQSMIYIEWAEKAGFYAEAIIENSIQNDTTFPPLARLNSALINKRSSQGGYTDPSNVICYYCCDTGYMPYLHDPEELSMGKHYIRMYACKCSFAPVGVPKYFDEWGNVLQFEKMRKNYDDIFRYPNVVEFLKTELNNAIQEQS